MHYDARHGQLYTVSDQRNVQYEDLSKHTPENSAHGGLQNLVTDAAASLITLSTLHIHDPTQPSASQSFSLGQFRYRPHPLPCLCRDHVVHNVEVCQARLLYLFTRCHTLRAIPLPDTWSPCEYG